MASKGPSSAAPDFEKIAAKTQSYEYFLNEVLREDLKNILERRDQMYLRVAEYMEQQNTLEKLTTVVATAPDAASQYKPEPLRTKVDIGCNFYVQGEIPTPIETITFDMGCGVWMEVTISEAIACCKQKISFFNKTIESLTKQELEVKARINVVLRGLQELQQLPNARPPEQPEPPFARYD